MLLPTDPYAFPRPTLPDYVDRLRAQIEAHERTIAQQAQELDHNRKIFQTASVAAKIGVWECTLPDETLHWSDGVYDLFDLPRGSVVTREQILKLYPDTERTRLHQIRRKAIEERSGFTSEIQIITANGQHRWIRLTATVECDNGVPVRIFGIKQDVTDERSLLDQTRYMAEFDVLTGVANRTQFQRRLAHLDPHDLEYCPVSALLLVDIDKFKDINDTYGHVVGDQCLVETANHLKAACPAAELVARIGGDEFAILLRPGLDHETIEAIGRLIVGSLSGASGTTGQLPRPGVSVGIAEFTGQSATDLFTQADSALYAAKNSGRHTVRMFEMDDSVSAKATCPAA